MTEIIFRVFGVPRPGGSKSGMFNRNTGKVMIFDSNKRVASWKRLVKKAAKAAYKGPLLDGALRVKVKFYAVRPKSHYGTGRNAGKLKSSAPKYPVVKPDATKLWRSTEDAITGAIWKDDARIVDQYVCKRYGKRAGCKIIISEVKS